MSGAACDRLANVAARICRPEREAFWNERAATIHATIDREAWSEAEGHYGGAFGQAHMDASLLQMVELRFIRADDPRFPATFAAADKALHRGRTSVGNESGRPQVWQES